MVQIFDAKSISALQISVFSSGKRRPASQPIKENVIDRAV
jgi:hypothetical protein